MIALDTQKQSFNLLSYNSNMNLSCSMDSICRQLHDTLKNAVSLIEIQSIAKTHDDKIVSKTKHETMCKLMNIIIDIYSES